MTNFDLLRKVSMKNRKKSPNANNMVLGDFIEKRPEHIDDRIEFGHWEIDTVIGAKDKNEPVLLKIGGKTAKDVESALEPLMRTSLSHDIFKSITSDNGLEFSSLTNAVQSVADVYFTHPHSSWE